MDEVKMKESKTSEVRKFRLRLVAIFLPIAIGIIGWVNAEMMNELFFLNHRLILALSAYSLTIGVGALLMFYLRGGINIPIVDTLATSLQPDERLGESAESKLYSRIEKMQSEVTLLAKSQVSIEEGKIEGVVESLKASIVDNLDQHIEESYSNKILKSRHVNSASDIYGDAVKRLSQEIEKLSRRANLNLVIGVLTTASAVGLLVYMVLGNEHVFSDVAGLMSYYIPRVTIVILVETFSFFFLRLYKSNLEEIKYYQSQITDINKNQIAHNVAVFSEELDLKKSFLSMSLTVNIDGGASSADLVEQSGKIASIADNLSKTVGSLAGKK